MNDLENMTVEDARTWYQRWYAPNNAMLVVVGDVDHKDVFALAEKYYGPLEGAPPAGAQAAGSSRRRPESAASR
jgi:zinc protease